MNDVKLFGRLVRDVDVRYSNSGTVSANFTLAVDRPKKKGQEKADADFVKCVAWNKQAEVIGNYFSKGNRMLLEGSIRTGSYTDKQAGKTVYTTDVWVDNFWFIDNKGNAHSTKPQKNQFNSSMEDFGDVEVSF